MLLKLLLLLLTQLTDGTSINIYNGFFVREMLSFRDARTGRTVTFNATIGCALAYIHCSEDSTSSTCYTSATNCPATASAAAAALTGRCPGSGSAIEAGWTFASRAVGGGVPSVLGVPEQAAAAGLITEKVVSRDSKVQANKQLRGGCVHAFRAGT